MPKIQETDTDRASEVFQDEVFNDEILDAYFRGHVSSQELINRIDALKQRASIVTSQEIEVAKDREFDEKCALGVA